MYGCRYHCSSKVEKVWQASRCGIRACSGMCVSNQAVRNPGKRHSAQKGMCR